MYCTKCGGKLDENEKYCSKCGNEIEKRNGLEIDQSIKSDDDKDLKIDKPIDSIFKEECIEQDQDYLFLKNMNSKTRDFIKNIIYVLKIVIGIIIFLITIFHIKSEFEEAQNYKLTLYIVRYVYKIGLMCLIQFVLEEISYTLSLKTNNLKKESNSTLICLGQIVYIFLIIIAWKMILFPSNVDMVQIYLAIVNDALLDGLLVIRVPIFLLIGASILKIFVIGNGINEIEWYHKKLLYEFLMKR